MCIGTNHFVSRYWARRYYAAQGLSKADVDAKITAGEICIGRPQLKPGQTLSVIEGEGRYQINEND